MTIINLLTLLWRSFVGVDVSTRSDPDIAWDQYLLLFQPGKSLKDYNKLYIFYIIMRVLSHISQYTKRLARQYVFPPHFTSQLLALTVLYNKICLEYLDLELSACLCVVNMRVYLVTKVFPLYTLHSNSILSLVNISSIFAEVSLYYTNTFQPIEDFSRVNARDENTTANVRVGEVAFFTVSLTVDLPLPVLLQQRGKKKAGNVANPTTPTDV